MRFEEPEMEIIHFEEFAITVTSNSCNDSYTGGYMYCSGSNMDVYCGVKMAATGG